MAKQNLFKKIFKKNRALKKFQDRNNKLISYEELSGFKLNEVYQIVPELPGAIECIRITSNNPNTLMFTVSMVKNQLWEKHYHDCEETCVVFKGKLTDATTGFSAGPAERLSFNPFQKHYVVAEDHTTFYVEFKKPKL